MSAPDANAFGNMSGRRPGVKIKLRRGRILFSFVKAVIFSPHFIGWIHKFFT